MQIVFLFLLSQFQLVQTVVQYIFIGKLAIAPFIQNCAVFYQQQTGVGTYNRLQRISSIWQNGYSAPVLSRHASISSSGEEVSA